MIRFFFFCTSLPFRLCLDHSFKELRSTTSLVSFTVVPVVLRVQRYDFFLSLQLFFQLFSLIFHLFFISLNTTRLQMQKTEDLTESRLIITPFRTFSRPSTAISTQKISQNSGNHGKTDKEQMRIPPRNVAGMRRKYDEDIIQCPRISSSTHEHFSSERPYRHGCF